MKIIYLLLFAHVFCCVTGLEINNFGVWGGNPVKITDAPFMARVLPEGGVWWCGGSIIHEQFVVTAAHCVSAKQYPIVSVAVGTDNVHTGGQDYKVENITVHPKYDMRRTDYDIAVIKLKEKLVLSDSVKPILIAESRPDDGAIAETFGFGVTENGTDSNILLGVKVPIVGRNECAQYHETSPRKICAGGETGKGSCNGDSGGPLIYQGKLVGAVSYGQSECANGVPVVYAYVPAFRDFIDNIINQ